MPTTVLVNAIGAIAVPLQTVWLDGVAVAIGVGLTVYVYVIGVPVQLGLLTAGVNRTASLVILQLLAFLPGVSVAKVPVLFSTP